MPSRLPTWTVAGEEHGWRLDKFLASRDRLGSRSRVGTALESGRVFVNEVEAAPNDAPLRLREGDLVRVWADRPGSAKRRTGSFRSGDLQILYEDDLIVVVNKPAGLLTVPLARRLSAPSVCSQLADHFHGQRGRRPFVVHRIDRDTSGIVLFAKTAGAHRALKAQFERREPERVYLAVVHGHPRPSSGTWRDLLAWDDRTLRQRQAHRTDPRRIEATSQYRVVEQFTEASLVEVRLFTGRRNQIRVQARLRGHALVGERMYAGSATGAPSIGFPRQALHAHRLAFRHPRDNRRVSFVAPLPADFADLLARLRPPRRGHPAASL